VTRVLRFVAGGAYVDVVRPPFTTEQFFAVFRDYNEAVWPTQIALLAIAARMNSSTFERAPRSSIAVGTLLVLYALVFYPAIGFALGQRYPAMPTLIASYAAPGFGVGEDAELIVAAIAAIIVVGRGTDRAHLAHAAV
jgi:hypothetical protein